MELIFRERLPAWTRALLGSHRETLLWWNQPESNRRHPACKAGVLPLNYGPVTLKTPPVIWGMEDLDEKVANIDLDGTVADYDKRMQEELEKLRSPHEPAPPRDRGQANYEDEPHMAHRRLLVKSQPGFWRTLPRIERGFEVVQVLRDIGFIINVLTKGPKAESVLPAWTEKAQWAAEHMPYASVTVTQHKERYFGRVLVDDWPPYFLPWLKARPRGLVIAVAQPWNADVEPSPNFIRYDGENIDAVRIMAQRAFDRKSREAL